MQGVRFDEVRCVTVDRAVVRATLSAMQEFGKRGAECLVLWLGNVKAGSARVRRAILPEQQAISDENGVGYFVSSETLFALNRALAESGLQLIAQVHSHPSEAYHSRADDRYAIVTSEGGLSLVVPDFGHAPADPASWAVYRLRQGDWQPLSREELQDLFMVGEQT